MHTCRLLPIRFLHGWLAGTLLGGLLGLLIATVARWPVAQAEDEPPPLAPPPDLAASDFDHDGLNATQEAAAGTVSLGHWRRLDLVPPVAAPALVDGFVAARNRHGQTLVNLAVKPAPNAAAVWTCWIAADDGTWTPVTPPVAPRPAGTTAASWGVFGNDLNDLGEVVGQESGSVGFLWRPAKNPPLGAPAGSSSWILAPQPGSAGPPTLPAVATRLNNFGDWVGFRPNPPNGPDLPVCVIADHDATPPNPSGVRFECTDINDSGEVLGTFFDPFDPHDPERMFLWRDGLLLDTGLPGTFPGSNGFDNRNFGNSAMNRFGEFAGWGSGSQSYLSTCYFFDGAFHLIADAAASEIWPTAVSDRGQVSGIFWDYSSCRCVHVLWNDGVLARVEDLDPAFAANSQQVVVDANGACAGFDLDNLKLLVLLPDQDQDGDGMSDDWETVHGLDPLEPGDRFEDPDGDGTDNLGEFLLRRDPHLDEEQAFLGGETPDLRPGIDTDGDGIPNTWEWAHGLDYNDAADGPQDPDHDGHTNLQEFHLAPIRMVCRSTASRKSRTT